MCQQKIFQKWRLVDTAHAQVHGQGTIIIILMVGNKDWDHRIYLFMAWEANLLVYKYICYWH